MFGKAYKLPFRVMGIPILLDITFLIVLPLFTWLIGSGIKANRELLGLDADVAGLRYGAIPYLLGFSAVVGLFISVLIHELGHAVTARLYGVRTRSITLWLLGGVAQLEAIPRQRGAEAVVAIIGPIVSIALAALFWLVLAALPAEQHAARFISAYLAQTNLILAVFNLLPALPLDGGRVLRSLLALKLDYLRATQLSGGISKVLAVGLGIFGFLSGQLMLMLIAFFIYMAVNGETQQTLMERMLHGIRVSDLMNRHVVTVSPHETAAGLTQLMIRERHRGFPVMDESGRLAGMVDLEGLEGVGPETPVEQMMVPEVRTVREDAPAVEAFAQMGQNGFGRMIVLDSGGRMVGIITKTDLMRAIQVRLAAMQPQPAIPRVDRRVEDAVGHLHPS